MKVVAFDPVTGASGDMILGALFDIGASPAAVDAALRRLGLDGFRLEFRHIDGLHHVRYGRCEVLLNDDTPAPPPGHDHDHGHDHTHKHDSDHGQEPGHKHDHEPSHPHHHAGFRTLTDIRKLLAHPSLPPRVRDQADRIFQRLAEAEAFVHGTTVEQVHFHEVGAVDSVADIVGSCLALEELGVERVYCAPLKVGTGTIRCAHGVLPNPAPATARLLEGFPVVRLEIPFELTTPTGAAILTTLSEGNWSGRPLRWLRTGAGHGGRTLEEGPNILRAILAEEDSVPAPAALPANPHVRHEDVTILETDIDDQNPELTAALPDLLRARGACDATLTPLIMKKGRPGVRLTVLAPPALAETLAELILQQSSSIGVRLWPAARRILDRSAATLPTPWGEVRAKRIVRPDGRAEVAPEYESCRELAAHSGRTVREVMTAAILPPSA